MRPALSVVEETGRREGTRLPLAAHDAAAQRSHCEESAQPATKQSSELAEKIASGPAGPRNDCGRAVLLWPKRHPKGITLVELLVVLVLFAIIAGTTGVALRRNPPPADDVAHSRTQLRREAIRSREPVTARDSLGYPIRFLPDGRAMGPGVDPLTGRTRAPR